MEKRRNPAIAAGLAGACVLCAPLPAQAASLDEALALIVENPAASFFAGVAAGVVATGIVSVAVCRAVIERDREVSELSSLGDLAATGSFRLPYGPEGRELELGDVAARPDGDAQRRPAQASDAAPGRHGVSPRHSAAPSRPAPARTAGEKASVPGSHATDDYEQIAQNYVNKRSFHQRMAMRAQGVAQTLRERVDAEMMEGLPVIERADGTVADVGTSWWNTSVGIGSVKGLGDQARIAPDEGLAIPSSFSAASDKDLLVEAAQAAVPAQEFMREGISKRVAFVDEGVFPEVRDAGDSVSDDDWAAALRSMDERFDPRAAAPEPAFAAPFEDIVGDSDTLDEPDGLEQSTAFIPFKPVAGHPEVVDAESYVNHLIEEEFERNSSKATRNVAGRFLRLLEGGTGTAAIPGRGRASDSGSLQLVAERPAYRPKHFAQADLELAMEA